MADLFASGDHEQVVAVSHQAARAARFAPLSVRPGADL